MRTFPLPSIYTAWKPWVEGILHLAVALLAFSLILLNRSPNLLRPISMNLRTGFALVMIAAVALLYLAFRLPGWIGRLLALTLTMSLFAFSLAGLWASGQTQTTALNGLIPLHDASDYYVDALRLLAGQDFSVFSARRPLFPGLFSVVLMLTGRNLMAALAVFTALTGLACYLAAREIQRTHGAEAAVFVLAILFLFYRAHSGVSMSENLGVPLGTLGFALIWRGTAGRSRRLVWAGILATTLALNARAGAFLILPLLLLWSGWFFRLNGEAFSWRVFITGILIVAAGFVINLMMVRWLATPTGVPFANFSYTLYGLASGGNWFSVFQVHPEVLALQEPEQSRRIYQLAFDLIRQHPEQMVKGILGSWAALFSDSWYNLYSYVAGENRVINLIARWGLYLLCLLGIYRWFRNRSDPLNGLMMVAALGVFISVPLLPPTDAYHMRPYAASMIVFGLLPAMGLAFVLERIRRGYFNIPADQLQGREWTVGFTTLVVMVLIVSPLAVKRFAFSPDLGPTACKLNTDSIVIHFDPGTTVNILRQNQPFLDWMPDFHVGLLRVNAHDLSDLNMTAWLASLPPPYSLFYTLDYRSHRKALVMIETSLLAEPGSLLELCGRWETSPDLAQYDIFYAEETVRLLH